MVYLKVGNIRYANYYFFGSALPVIIHAAFQKQKGRSGQQPGETGNTEEKNNGQNRPGLFLLFATLLQKLYLYLFVPGDSNKFKEAKTRLYNE